MLPCRSVLEQLWPLTVTVDNKLFSDLPLGDVTPPLLGDEGLLWDSWLAGSITSDSTELPEHMGLKGLLSTGMTPCSTLDDCHRLPESTVPVVLGRSSFSASSTREDSKDLPNSPSPEVFGRGLRLSQSSLGFWGSGMDGERRRTGDDRLTCNSEGFCGPFSACSLLPEEDGDSAAFRRSCPAAACGDSGTSGGASPISKESGSRSRKGFGFGRNAGPSPPDAAAATGRKGTAGSGFQFDGNPGSGGGGRMGIDGERWSRGVAEHGFVASTIFWGRPGVAEA